MVSCSFGHTSSAPAYQLIAGRLERDIKESYQPEQALPPEKTLAEQFGVSRHTVRHAIDQLVQKGLLQRRRGKGIYVLDHPFDYWLNGKTCFSDNFGALGQRTRTEILAKDLVAAPKDAVENLTIEPGTHITKVECLRLVNNGPFCVSTHFFAGRIGRTIREKYQGGSLHSFFRERLHLEVRRTESRFTAVLPELKDARALDIATSVPVLRVKSVNIDANTQQPVEFVVTRFRGDRVWLYTDFEDKIICE